jgi:[ribosomal protein S5]-alanine N-acetyltransferase
MTKSEFPWLKRQADFMNTIFPSKIQTERLVLRPPVAEDADVIFSKYTQDPAVARFMVWVPHTSLEHTRNFISSRILAWSNNSAFPYVLTSRQNGEVLGMLEARVSGHGVNIGYVLARDYWGQGLMPEAIRALVAIALHELAFYRVEATCDVDNVASARTLEKSAFLKEGRLARFVVHPNISVEPRDSWLYAITR